jgi:hypothetical protein
MTHHVRDRATKWGHQLRDIHLEKEVVPDTLKSLEAAGFEIPDRTMKS